MTAMPQLVAIFNGLGGSASGLIAAGELYNLIEANSEIAKDTTITIMISTIMVALPLTGSLIAFWKNFKKSCQQDRYFYLQKYT